MMATRSTILGFVFALLVPSSAEAAASDAKPVATPGTQGVAEPFFGGYQQTVPINVPSCHGIEPKLALTYDSVAGNGFAGVGWRLSGWSTIERGRPGHGAPRYDGGDAFFLDGQQLVPCPVNTKSPGCRYGGTHVAKIETYERIQHDGGSDR